MTTTPNDPTAGDLLADANLIIILTTTTDPTSSVAHWRHRYQQWLAKQNHPARGGVA